MASLAVEIAGLKLDNPTMLAAGILGMSGLTLKQVAEAGAGAVVTKSLGLNPRSGYSNPTVVQVESGLINAMGLPNPGIDYFTQELREAGDIRVPLIVSIYGFTPMEFAVVAEKAVRIGADAVELNVSCPHTEKTGAEIGQNPKLIEKTVETTRKRIKTPIFVKLTPNVTDITESAKAAERGGADAVTAINTVKAMVIDIETGRPVLGNKMGGLSGPAIKPIAVRCIYEIYEAVKIPVIGCGGVTTWRDAVEFIQAGATLVQIGTAIAAKRLHVFKQVTDEIRNFMNQRGFEGVEEIIGLSHRC